MSSIEKNLQYLHTILPKDVTLVAVSKTKPVSDIMEAYQSGQRIFGENKIQEMTHKWEELPNDIQWHMIGHVQTNKVKYMAPYVHTIHAVDSYKLLKEINKQAKKHNRVINCLLQIKIATEENKYGLSQADALQLLAAEEIKDLSNISITGLMGMATFTENEEQLNSEFKKISAFFEKVKINTPSIKTLSIGMSGDYKIAIQCGSTMVRIGSAIFGVRNYSH